MWREFFKPIMWHSNRKTNYFSSLKLPTLNVLIAIDRFQILYYERLDQLIYRYGELVEINILRKFARKFSNIDFFLRILPLKVDQLVMSEM